MTAPSASEQELWDDFYHARHGTTALPHQPVASTSAASALLQQSSEAVTQRRVEEERERRKYTQAIGRVGDAVCAQLHAAWREHGRYNMTDFEVGSGDPRERCVDCKPKIYDFSLYLIQDTTPEEIAAGFVDALRRHKNYSEMYLREEAAVDAELCGFIGVQHRRSSEDMARRRREKAANQRSRVDLCAYNCLIHVCVEELCTLPLNAVKKARDLYNRIHQRPLANTATVAAVGALSLEPHVYFCSKHVRFHLCDEFCNQTQPGRHNERICTLSGRVKRGAESEVGELRDAGAPSASATAAPMDADAGAGVKPSVALDEDDAFAENDAKDAHKRVRKAAYNEVSVIRDRVSTAQGRGALPMRRSRGRGRGSIAGGVAERARLDRVRLAQTMAKSSGDDDAALISPVAAAMEFERIAAGEIVRRSTNSYIDADGNVHVGVGQRSTSKRRKLGRAKRVKSRLASQSAQMTLDVPSNFIDLEASEEEAEGDGDEAEEEYHIKPEPSDDNGDPFIEPEQAPLELPRLDGVKREHDQIMNSRLATPVVGCSREQQQLQLRKRKNAMVTVSFDVRARVPFAERVAGKNDEEFAYDILTVQRDRKERLERFRLGGSAATNTFFSTSELFEQYGERACAIIWQLLCSRERDAIEREKIEACAGKARSEVDAYCYAQRKDGRVCLAERVEQIARGVHDRSGIFKRIVIDELLLKIVETYMALVVIEFYFNLVSMPRRLSMHLSQETADTIQNQFFFEDFVPAILSLHHDGLVINGVTILPRDAFLLREYWPQPSTLRTMGIADQTMTHLVSTIRAYIEAARSSNVSMRRFEATVIDFERLIQLRARYMVAMRENEELTSREVSRLAARELVGLFIVERARRLEALVHT